MDFTENLLIEAVYRHTKRELTEDNRKEILQIAALGALEYVKKAVVSYQADFFLFGLVLSIMEKKSRMILKAKSKEELKEIVKPSVPRGSYGQFFSGPYHVEEEELIIWSKASLEAPLNEDGVKRYQELFTKFFPEQAAEIWR